MSITSKRLIVVSNRLPVSVQNPGGSSPPVVAPSSGGLVTALGRVLAVENGTWIGWPGTTYDPQVERLLAQGSARMPYALAPVFLTREEITGFYHGFSNEIIWPLFHDLQSRCNFEPDYWSSYQRVNRTFADTVLANAAHDDLIWVQDYHLVFQARYLREAGLRSQMVFFQHIPFPSPDIFEKLPWRREILSAMLEFDLLGFQSSRDRKNFIACVREILPDVELQRAGEFFRATTGNRSVLIGSFPISIDFREFSMGAMMPEVLRQVEKLRADLHPCRIVLGVDRLDYTKGIYERMKAFALFLRNYPELHRQVTLVQVAVPSREDIPKYRELRLDIERMVTEINGRYTQPGWVPIQYMHRSLSREELLALYRAADVALVTPLKDGMNLVAKEYCAAQLDHQGALILSEFAGAAAELKSGALMVNPYDLDGVASALHQALNMPTGERRARMKKLRHAIRRSDIYGWAGDFFAACRKASAGSSAEPTGSASLVAIAS